MNGIQRLSSFSTYPGAHTQLGTHVLGFFCSKCIFLQVKGSLGQLSKILFLEVSHCLSADDICVFSEAVAAFRHDFHLKSFQPLIRGGGGIVKRSVRILSQRFC